jgi:CoA:oxalate CoA-transferase
MLDTGATISLVPEETESVTAGSGATGTEPSPPSGRPFQRPLDDVVVLDLSQFAAGPYGTQFLADAGARVIKVELPGLGDPYRHEGPPLPGGGRGDGTFFMRFNRNKRSVALDLRRPGGRRAFERLVRAADVLVENFKPGSMERLGFGWERLQELNPRLVYATVTGYGHPDLLPSPLSHWPAFAITAEAMGGMMDVIGDAGCEPHGSAVSAGDLVAGIEAALGIMFALHQRQRTARGQRVDVGMADAIAALNERSVFSYNLTGVVPTRGQERQIAPFGAFPTTDGHVAIGVIGPAVWRRFCQAIERLDLAEDPDLADGIGRAANLETKLRPAISAWLEGRTKMEAATILSEAGVPAAPVMNAREVSESPHFESRRMLAEFEYPGAGRVRVMGAPIKLGADLDAPVSRPPLLGEDTDAVLSELAGLDGDEIAELRREGAIA